MLETLLLHVSANLTEPNNVFFDHHVVSIADTLRGKLNEFDAEEMEAGEDEEHFDTLKDLVELFEGIAQHLYPRQGAGMKEFLQNYWQRFNWDNYQAEQHEPRGTATIDRSGYYKLGSVFSRKISWAEEGCEDEELRTLLVDINFEDRLTRFLNELENKYFPEK